MIRERGVVLDAVGAVRALDTGTLDLVALPTLAVDPLARSSGGSASRIPASSCASPSPTTRPRSSDRSPTVAARSASPSCPRAATISSRSRSRARRSSRCARRERSSAPGRVAVVRARGHAAGRDTARQVDARLARPRARGRVESEADIAVEMSQREAIAPLVLGGAGHAFLPRAMAETLAAQGAVVARLAPRAHAHDRARAPGQPAHARGARVRRAARAAVVQRDWSAELDRGGQEARRARQMSSVGDVGPARVVPAPRFRRPGAAQPTTSAMSCHARSATAP